MCRFEGTASHQYSGLVAAAYRPVEGEEVLGRMPEEAPMPQPGVGVRLHIFPDTTVSPREELRTKAHNTFKP